MQELVLVMRTASNELAHRLQERAVNAVRSSPNSCGTQQPGHHQSQPRNRAGLRAERGRDLGVIRDYARSHNLRLGDIAYTLVTDLARLPGLLHP